MARSVFPLSQTANASTENILKIHRSNNPSYYRAWSMIVLTLDWESGINPILLALGIVTYIRVAQRRQFTGGVFRGVSGRTGAVNDDFGIPIRKELRSKRRHIVRRQIYCSG